jgi:carbamoyl-phosphate synthase small subunit
VVFNTSLSGYQEILSDPSYAGQMVCFTSVQIGNTGCNDGARPGPAAPRRARALTRPWPAQTTWRAARRGWTA